MNTYPNVMLILQLISSAGDKDTHLIPVSVELTDKVKFPDRVIIGQAEFIIDKHFPLIEPLNLYIKRELTYNKKYMVLIARNDNLVYLAWHTKFNLENTKMYMQELDNILTSAYSMSVYSLLEKIIYSSPSNHMITEDLVYLLRQYYEDYLAKLKLSKLFVAGFDEYYLN